MCMMKYNLSFHQPNNPLIHTSIDPIIQDEVDMLSIPPQIIEKVAEKIQENLSKEGKTKKQRTRKNQSSKIRKKIHKELMEKGNYILPKFFKIAQAGRRTWDLMAFAHFINRYRSIHKERAF